MSQIDKDLAGRRRDIIWPQSFLPDNAALFAHNELVIGAPCGNVWEHLIQGPKWPTWFVLTKTFEIEGGAERLSLGITFRWGSSAFQVHGQVVTFEAPHDLRFTGAAPGELPAFLHIWKLYEEAGGCLAVYEEVGIGKRAIELGKMDNGALHRSHDLMLAGLKWISESRKV